jgi:hypothetical protein
MSRERGNELDDICSKLLIIDGCIGVLSVRRGWCDLRRRIQAQQLAARLQNAQVAVDRGHVALLDARRKNGQEAVEALDLEPSYLISLFGQHVLDGAQGDLEVTLDLLVTNADVLRDCAQRHAVFAQFQHALPTLDGRNRPRILVFARHAVTVLQGATHKYPSRGGLK